LICTGDGDIVIETEENIVWEMEIVIQNYWGSLPWTNIVVTDKLAAELELDSPFPLSITQGTVSNYTTGKSKKVHLTWVVGTLNPNEVARLKFRVSTDLNPAGKQEYTTPGCYELNSGPTMKFKVGGIQYSEEMPSIWVEVLPKS